MRSPPGENRCSVPPAPVGTHSQTRPHLPLLLLSEALAERPDCVTLLIGPEGGFSRDEVAKAQDSGFEPVSLGPLRLRAETAAVAAMAVVLQAQAVHAETPEHTGR